MTSLEEFSADMARQWLDDYKTTTRRNAEQFVKESVIVYVREACQRGNVQVTLPDLDHSTALIVLQILEAKGFEVNKVASTDTETRLGVAWPLKEGSHEKDVSVCPADMAGIP